MNNAGNRASAIRYPYHASSAERTVLAFHADAIWREIRDFNTYPNYIEGVTESVLEDDMRGDQIGCIRRFVYLGDVIRQTLVDHSDAERRFSHAGCEPLTWPTHRGRGVGPAIYENRIQVTPMRADDRSRLTWSMDYWAQRPADASAWKAYFDEQIPVWVDSLRRYMAAVG